MLLKAIFVFVSGYLTTVNATTILPPLPRLSFGDVYYTRPDHSSRQTWNWNEAQQKCKDLNATLPIFENLEHHESFEAAIRDLTTQYERNMGLWLGAKAFSGQWSWLNGSIGLYHGTDVQPSQGEYKNSYAYVSKTPSGKVLPFASSPTIRYSYICSYPILPGSTACKNETNQTAFYIGSICYAKYEKILSWFSARNACLASGGDLASFSNISFLEGYIDSNPVWIGLRKSTWIWQNAVTCLSSDVTFTLWKTDQPNDETPNCISTDSYDNFTGWRDWNCTNLLPFICQVNTTWVSKTTAACTTPSTPSGGIRVSSSTIENNSGTTHSASPKEDQQKSDTGSVNINLAVGLGVGIGVPVIILITIVIIVVIVRRKRRSSMASGNSQSRKTFVSENSPQNSKSDQMELNATENGGTRMDNSAAQYATITEATGPKLNPPSTQGTVYEDLGFDQAGSS